MPPPALRQHAGALEHREEAAGRLARGPGELGDVGLGDAQEHVAGAARRRRGPARRGRSARTATRLWTVWKDWRARRSLATRRRRPSEMTSFGAMSGCSRIRRRMSAPRMPTTSVSSTTSTVAERFSSSNIASSPKMSPGAEARQRDRAAVRVLADRAGLAGAHDVARVAVVALAEDDLAGGRSSAAPRPRRRAAGRSRPASRTPGRAGAARAGRRRTWTSPPEPIG